MPPLNVPNTFTNNTVADGTEVNANFTEVENHVNGAHITDVHVESGADIDGSKIAAGTLPIDRITPPPAGGPLGADSVTAVELRDDAAVDGNRSVTTDHIRNNAVTDAKVATGLSGTKISDGTIADAKISDVSGSKLAALSVPTGALAAGAVTAAKILDGAAIKNVLVGNFTIPGATGNYSETGVGFTPKLVVFVPQLGDSVSSGNISFGVMDDSGNQFVVAMGSNATDGGRFSTASWCLAVSDVAGGSVIEAQFVSMDADGFTVNFLDVTPAATAYYIAMG